jgi:CRISPR-associated protein Csy2
MSQYILISRLNVQNANAIAGFTWGFPAITHFLGFTHNLELKLKNTREFADISLSGCAVIAHEQHVHRYGKFEAEFVQSRNPPYMHGLENSHKGKTAPIIEEGKMNMTVSLLIGCSGTVGNRKDALVNWLNKACLTQRLAGGSILNHGLNIEIFSDIDDNLRLIKRKLLPGFVLIDRANYLQAHYETLCKAKPETELLDAWLDFAALKKAARPKSDLISEKLQALFNANPDDTHFTTLRNEWQQHIAQRYHPDAIPNVLKLYFADLKADKTNEELLRQWKNYLAPDEKTDADWEYQLKPKMGYLVPIMTGYKAISKVYDKVTDVKNARDNEYLDEEHKETRKHPVCFVEAVHSVGEWLGVHKIKDIETLNACLWHYHHEQHWYLCNQQAHLPADLSISASETEEELNFY